MFRISLIAGITCAGMLGLQSAHAQFIDPFEGQTEGETAFNYWFFHNSVYNNNSDTDPTFKGDYGSSPGSSAWSRGAASYDGTTGNGAELIKTGGNLYIGGTLYSGGYSIVPGAYGASAEFVVGTALEGVKTITLQWTTTTGIGGDIQEGPTLYINGGLDGFAANLSQILSQVEEEPFVWDGIEYLNYTTTYYYQWNLSEDVDFFNIAFDMEQHSRIYEAQIDQSTVALAIPEPSTFALIGVGLAGAAFLRRRRRAA